jgi:hypothetical protein
MATTSVKLSESSKERLDRLQARLTLLGHKLTKEQILELMIETASERPGDLIGRAVGVRRAMPEEEIESLIEALVEDWGVRTSWKDIDRILYGGGRR